MRRASAAAAWWRSVRGCLLALAVLAALGALAPRVALADDDDAAARGLFVEAVRLTEQAEHETDAARRVDLLEQARSNLARIVEQYPTSELAVQIVTNQPIGDFDPATIEDRLAAARAALEGPQPTASRERPAAEPEPDRLPTAPVDPGSRAGRIVDGMVDAIRESNAALDGRPKFSVGAPITAADTGKAVVVTFPRVLVEHAEGGRNRLGDIAFKITPRDKQSYDFSVDWPRVVEVRNETELLTARITVGEFGFTGRWHAGLETLTQIDAIFRNVVLATIEAGAERPHARVGSIAVKQDYEQGDDGLWSGPFSLDVADFAILPEGMGDLGGLEGLEALRGLSEREGLARREAARIAGIAVTGDMTDVDLEAWRALSDGLETALAGPPGDGPGADGASDLARTIGTMALGSVRGAFRVSGLEFSEDGRDAVALNDVSLSVGLDARETPATATFGISAAGLDVAELDLAPEYLPRRAALDLTFERFPVRAILASAAAEMSRRPADEDPIYDGGLIDEDALIALLTDNATEINVTNLTVETPISALTAQGRLAVDPVAFFGVSGRFDATITGLDRLIRFTARSNRPDASDILGLLTLVKGLGRPETGPDGAFKYAYDIEIPPSGVVTINGTPIDFLQQRDMARLTTAAGKGR